MLNKTEEDFVPRFKLDPLYAKRIINTIATKDKVICCEQDSTPGITYRNLFEHHLMSKGLIINNVFKPLDNPFEKSEIFVRGTRKANLVVELTSPETGFSILVTVTISKQVPINFLPATPVQVLPSLMKVAVENKVKISSAKKNEAFLVFSLPKGNGYSELIDYYLPIKNVWSCASVAYLEAMKIYVDTFTEMVSSKVKEINAD
jgi:hypothetical protein